MAADRPVKIVALGDSLVAGYGLPANAAVPVQLEKALAAKGEADAERLIARLFRLGEFKEREE